MNAQNFIKLLEQPESLTDTQTEELRDITLEFPYFQAGHALRLKGLKNQDSFRYNTVLKQTAVRTIDRTILFDYITSATFIQNDISSQIKSQEARIKNVQVFDQVDISALLEQDEQDKASKILDPNLFIEKEDSLMTPKSPEETLSLGKPLDFDKNEAHSFMEWLTLSSFKPIDRSNKEKQENPLSDTKESESQIASQQEVTQNDGADLKNDLRRRKQEIIDSFIETNPKIQISQPSKTAPKPVVKEPLFSEDSLMTETLARVYIEQKNYKKAKQAFRILSLKYPEKSGFFADQIRAVEQLEEQKD